MPVKAFLLFFLKTMKLSGKKNNSKQTKQRLQMVCTHVTSCQCFDETKGNICMKTELMASPQGILQDSQKFFAKVH